MARIDKLSGVQKVIFNMRKANARNSLAVNRILKKSGLLLQRVSQKLVPVDIGNLKASAFTRARGLGFRTEVTVGYTALYAIAVHESIEMVLEGEKRIGKRPDGTPRKGAYWDPQGSRAKFLEIPFRNLKDFPAFKAIVAAEVLRKVKF